MTLYEHTKECTICKNKTTSFGYCKIGLNLGLIESGIRLEKELEGIVTVYKDLTMTIIKERKG